MAVTKQPRFVEPKLLVPRAVDGVPTPHDLHAEASVLSVLINANGREQELLEDAASLRPEHFYQESHRRVFGAMLALAAAKQPLDLVTVRTWLHDAAQLEAVGGMHYLAELLNGVLDAIPRNFKTYVEIVLERARRRALIAKLQENVARAYHDGESFAVVLGDAAKGLQSFEADLTGLRVESCADIDEEQDDSAKFLVPSLKIGPGRPTLFAGDAYTGKTLALQELALAVATGKITVWGAHKVAETGRVLWLNWEAPKKGWRHRLRRLRRSHKITAQDLEGRFDVAHHPELFLDDDNAEAAFAAATRGYKLCIIDSLVASVKNTQEKDEEMGRIILRLLRVSDRNGCTFIIIHHTTKPPQGSPRAGAKGSDLRDAKDSIRGSRSIFGACDGVFVLVSTGKKKPVRVVHEKSIDETIEDQHLRFCDEELEFVNDDGDTVRDAKWGLYCEHLPPEQMAALKAAEKKVDPLEGNRVFDQFCERVLEIVKANPGVTGAGVKERCLKVSKDRVYAALEALKSKGKVQTEDGPRRAVFWRAV